MPSEDLLTDRKQILPRTASRRALRSVTVLLMATLVAAAGCATPPRWRADDEPSHADIATLFTAEGSSGVFREMTAGEIPVVPVRRNLRPCCAFGEQIRVRLGPLPIPGFRLPNIVDRQNLGRHFYDSGVAQVASRGDDSGVFHSENNGLIYTCRGGFIDTAHVRDYADWTLFIATSIARNLERGVELKLPDEGGVRTVTVKPIDAAIVERIGRRATALPLGQWLAFQLSVWHEIATWFGWSSVAGFSEKVSAFSPEDLYSNLLGTRLAAAVASQRTARDEYLYNRSLDQWLQRALDHLGAVPAEVGMEAMQAVDGLWWDSSRRIPDTALVTRRNLNSGETLLPWLVPPERAGDGMRAACGSESLAQPFSNPESLGELRFKEYVRFSVAPSAQLMAVEPFHSMGRTVSHQDFPAIIEFIRKQVRHDFGPGADRPDG